MSKKSRRRNQKILGALAAIGTGLALANRGKGMESSNIGVGGGKDAATMKMPKTPDRKMGKIPRRNKNFLANPKINKMDTSEVDIDFTPGVSKRVPGQSIFANQGDGIRSMFEAGSTDGLGNYYSESFKKGGRVGCGIAKKGYGKAMKRRKK